MSMVAQNFVTQSGFRSFIGAVAGAALLCAAGVAQAGPCSAQIDHVEQQIRKAQAAASPGGAGAPTAPQTIDAQLHHQPTAQSVESAQAKAAAAAAGALNRAREADAHGDMQACAKALQEAKQLYGIY